MRTAAIKITATTAAIAAASVAMVGCSSAVPTETPGVQQMGTFVRRHTGPEVEVALGYKYAAAHLGEEWLILELAVTSPERQTAAIERGNVFVRTPDGKRIPLATQREFGAAYGSLRGQLRKADVMRDPLGYFSASRQGCRLGFFATPTEGVTFDQVTVSDRRLCFGRIFFRVPGGIQSGRWVLGIELVESSVRLPFEL